MPMDNELRNRVLAVFRKAFRRSFGSGPIVARQVEEWDSLSHLNLVMALEEEFGLEFDPDDIAALFSDFDTVLAIMVEKLEG